MKFRFKGAEACPDEITLRGVEFSAGKPVEVTDPSLAAKLSALPYFEVVQSRARKADAQDVA